MREMDKIPKDAKTIPENVDLIKLADEIKAGMTKKFLRDLEELKKARVKARLAV